MKEIISYRAEADTCNAFVEFLEATWDFQSSFMDQKEKKVNDELEIHEEYFVNVARSLLSAYKDALGPAIVILREHMKNIERYEKAIDPDEEFLQDIEQRISLEHSYLAAETKVITIFDAAETVKEQFYLAVDNVSRKGIEPVHELCEDIEKVKGEFESLPRPILGNDKSAHLEQVLSKESPQKGVSPSSKSVLPVDLKSILTQKLVTISPQKKPYIPLGGSPENSPSNPNDNMKPVERKQEEVQVREDDKSSTPNKEPSKLALEIEKENREELIVGSQESNDKKFLEPSTSNDEKSVDINIEKTIQHEISESASQSSTSDQSETTSDSDEEPTK